MSLVFNKVAAATANSQMYPALIGVRTTINKLLLAERSVLLGSTTRRINILRHLQAQLHMKN